MHLGLVAPLPPTPAGAAEWVAVALPLLEQHARITCFVENPDEVSPALRAAHDVRHVDERAQANVDMLVYHVGNNPYHGFVFDALLEGPAGLVEVHDGSLHHYIQERTLGIDNEPLSYIEFGAEAHGWAGRQLADMRWRRYRGAVELFLYDYLPIVLDRSRGVIVHSHYAEELVQLRSPRVHTWRVPLHAPELAPDPGARRWTGIPADKLLVAHLGFITLPKRHDVYMRAMRKAVDRGLDAHFVFAGKPDPIVAKALPQLVDELGLSDRVTITGYLETSDLERWVKAVDVIVNMRAPHVGESSGSLAYGLSAGKPVVVQPVGSWAEIPDDAVVRLPVTDDDASALADTIFALGQDAALRERFGKQARAYADEELDPHMCVERLVQAAREAMERDWTPPAWVAPGRTMAALTFLRSGNARVEKLLHNELSDHSGAAHREALTRITPARPHDRLLAIDVAPVMVQLLATIWGYDVDVRTTTEVAPVSPPEQPGIPVYTVEPQLLTDQLTQLAAYDVIVAGHVVGDDDRFLAECNRALVPQGLLVVLDRQMPLGDLDAGGFSPRVHDDHPRWVIRASETPRLITVGTKASIPETAV